MSALQCPFCLVALQQNTTLSLLSQLLINESSKAAVHANSIYKNTTTFQRFFFCVKLMVNLRTPLLTSLKTHGVSKQLILRLAVCESPQAGAFSLSHSTSSLLWTKTSTDPEEEPESFIHILHCCQATVCGRIKVRVWANHRLSSNCLPTRVAVRPSLSQRDAGVSGAQRGGCGDGHGDAAPDSPSAASPFHGLCYQAP